MPRPRCRCDDLKDSSICTEEFCIHADATEWDSFCYICWQYHYSEPHRKLWGGVGPAKEPKHPKPALVTKPQEGREPVRISLNHRPPGVKSRITTSNDPRPRKETVAQVFSPSFKLGDKIEAALNIVGITKEEVASVFGSCRGCASRQAILNKLSDWAETALHQKKETALGLFQSLFKKKSH